MVWWLKTLETVSGTRKKIGDGLYAVCSLVCYKPNVVAKTYSHKKIAKKIRPLGEKGKSKEKQRKMIEKGKEKG